MPHLTGKFPTKTQDWSVLSAEFTRESEASADRIFAFHMFRCHKSIKIVTCQQIDFPFLVMLDAEKAIKTDLGQIELRIFTLLDAGATI